MNDYYPVENISSKEVPLNENIVTDKSSGFASKNIRFNKKSLLIFAGVAFILLLILMIFFIPSNASKSVSAEIENISGVSFENYDNCLEIQKKYNSLSPLDKIKVLNYGHFEDEIELFCIFIDSSIESSIEKS